MRQQAIPQDLTRIIARGNYALFLGCEGIISSQPLMPSFSEYLSEGRPADPQSANSFSVAQYYESEYERAGLVQKLRAYLVYVLPCLEPVYHSISQLSPRFIITTTTDTRLETILHNTGLPVATIVRNEDVPSAADDEKVKVVKLFGCIEHPDTLVLTERDFIDLPEKSGRILDVVVTALARHPFLIVGQPLQDIHFRRLYRSMIHELGGQFHQSYALCSAPSVDVEYWQKQNVRVILGNEERLLRHAAELLCRESQSVTPQRPVHVSIKASEPYKFLDYFETEDTEIFFGRKVEVNRVSQRIISHRLTVLCGKSGVGKTSLIKAGISPLLSSNRHYLPVYTRCGEDPAQSILRVLGQLEPGLSPTQASLNSLSDSLVKARQSIRKELIIFIDQFEEFFIKIGEEVNQHFLRELMTCLTSSTLSARFVLSLREDYLSRLADASNAVPIILHNVYRLKELTIDNAKSAIEEPARAFGIEFDECLAETIIKDIGSTEIAPPQIQIVCYTLYHNLGEARVVTAALYEKLGGIKQILIDYLEESLTRFEGRAEQVKVILKAMVTSEGTKSLLSLSDITLRSGLNQPFVEQVLDDLVNKHRLARKVPGENGFQFELAHEYLTFKIWQWFGEDEILQKEIQELMERELNSWRRFQHLRLGKDKLKIFNDAANKLKIGEEGFELLLLSSIKHLEDCEHWVNRIQELDAHTQDRIANSIMDVFSDSRLVLRRQAAEALASIGIQPLLRALENRDTRWKCVSIEMLGGLEAEEAVGALIRALAHEEVSVRVLACGALGEIGRSIRNKSEGNVAKKSKTARTIHLILKSIRQKLASNEDHLVLISAIAALSQVATDRGVSDWLPLLLSNNNEVVNAVEKTLNSLKYYNLEERETVYVYVPESEFNDPDDPAILSLVKALRSKDKKLCERIVDNMGEWECAPSALLEALSSEKNKQALLHVIEILTKIGDPRSRPQLIIFTGRASSPLREAALKALDVIPSTRDSYKRPERVLSHVNDMNQLIEYLANRGLATEAEDRLVEIGDLAVDNLIDALKSFEWRVRKHAASALGRIGEIRAEPYLEELVDDAEEQVSKAAQNAIAKFKPTSKVWMKDWQESFRDRSR